MRFVTHSWLLEDGNCVLLACFSSKLEHGRAACNDDVTGRNRECSKSMMENDVHSEETKTKELMTMTTMVMMMAAQTEGSQSKLMLK